MSKDIKKKLSTIRWNTIFNPFDTVLFASNHSPHSRSLHTSLVTKIKDTFEVFRGGTRVSADDVAHYFLLFLPESVRLRLQKSTKFQREISEFSLATRPGLFDYMTLGIFRGAHYALNEMHELYREWREALKTAEGLKAVGLVFLLVAFALPISVLAVSAALHFIGNGLLRPLLSGVFTALCLPVITFAHVVTLVVKKTQQMHLEKTLQIEQEETSRHQATTVALGKVLNAKGKSLGDLVAIAADPLDRNTLRLEVETALPTKTKSKKRNTLFGLGNSNMYLELKTKSSTERQYVQDELAAVNMRVREASYDKSECLPRR